MTTASQDSAASQSRPRPTVIQLTIQDREALYAAYIPLFTEGGIFVPSERQYMLGQDVYLLLTLPGDTQRYSIAGKVAWITPAGATGARTQGIGVAFPGDEKSRALKNRIEEILLPLLAADRPTHIF